MSFLEDLFSLRGRVALVTGGATGLGAMLAEGLVRAGAHVVIASRKRAACEAAAARMAALGPGTAEAATLDVANEADLVRFAQEMRAQHPKLDILVNNAGVSWGAPMDSFPHAQWARVMGVNVAAPFTLTRELLPALKAAATPQRPARVVNIGSIMGTAPVAEGAYSYTASKAAVHHLTRTLAGEFAGDQITVNALAPGPFPSNMTAFATGTEAGAAKVGRNVPLGRIGAAKDAAGAIVYLCSDAGAYISGAILPLDGGMSAATPLDLFANTLGAS
ncbi:MAG: SDR family oxidoreductase [Pseudomonadota bacterium]